MRVEHVYTPAVRTCRLGSTLAEVASIMWESDCGVVPVVDYEGKPCGIITDRDICIALCTQPRFASSTMVQDVVGKRVFVCFKEDSVESALETMRRERVRRLPVLDEGGRVTGILSLTDVIRILNVPADGLEAETLRTLQSVSAHRKPAIIPFAEGSGMNRDENAHFKGARRPLESPPYAEGLPFNPSAERWGPGKEPE